MNKAYALFFKANLLLTSLLFLAFLIHHQGYTLLNFILSILGAVSSYYFSSSYKKIEFKAELDKAYQGIKISYKF